MKQSEIDLFTGAEFTTAEITRTRNIIIDRDFAQTKALLLRLTLYSDAEPPVALPDDQQSERKLMRSHLKVYFDKFLDGTLAAKGGKRGTDYDNLRDKDNLRREVRRMLGLPSLTDEETVGLTRTRKTSSSFRKVVIR